MADEMLTGERVRQFRTRLGWQQVDLARALDVTQKTVSRWERGQTLVPHVVDLALRQLACQQAKREASRG